MNDDDPTYMTGTPHPIPYSTSYGTPQSNQVSTICYNIPWINLIINGDFKGNQNYAVVCEDLKQVLESKFIIIFVWNLLFQY